MMKRWITIIALFLTACGTGMDPFVGMQQAEREAQYYSSALTATADVKVFAITQTSAAFAMVQTQTAYPYTATALAWTPTPVPTATPNAAATLVMANAQAQATQAANDTAMSNMKRQRQEYTNKFWAAILPIFLIMMLLAVAYVAISISRERKLSVIDRGDDKPLIANRVTGEIIDVDLMPNYSTGGEESLLRQAFEQWMESKGFKPKLPHITAERQDAVKERDQYIDLKARALRLPKQLLDSQSSKSLPQPTITSSDLETFPLPEWDKLMSYQFQAGGEFPFGSFAQELARIDVNKYPHIGLVGPTGCGKSRLFLRPFTASALASGNRVIILGDMVDFVVFKMHPNATLVPVYQITKPQDAAQYVHALAVINSEMERRFRQLIEQNLSTWERSGGENTLIVLDELGPNLDILDETNPQAARALRGFLSILISKGRKAGFNFVFASTRAVGLKKQLSQVSTIAFRLKDTDEERYAFGQSGFGADKLPESYFLSKIGSTVRMTGSFNPNDQQLADFLMQHTTKELDKPTWIEGVFAPVENKQIEADSETSVQFIAPHDQESLPQAPINEIAQLAESIRADWRPDMSLTKTSQLLGKPYGGQAWTDRVKEIVKYLTDTTTTTTEKSPESGVFEPVYG